MNQAALELAPAGRSAAIACLIAALVPEIATRSTRLAARLGARLEPDPVSGACVYRHIRPEARS